MIQIDDIQKGNILSRNGQTIRVAEKSQSSIGIRVVFDMDPNGIMFSPKDEFSPIKIDDSWLIKLGFKKGSSNQFTKDNFLYHIYVLPDQIEFWIEEGNKFIEVDLGIEFIHDLQNFYFKFTKENLNEIQTSPE